MRVNLEYEKHQKRSKKGLVSAEPIEFGHPLIGAIYNEVIMNLAGYRGVPSIEDMEPGEYDQRAYIIGSCLPISAMLKGGM